MHTDYFNIKGCAFVDTNGNIINSDILIHEGLARHIISTLNKEEQELYNIWINEYLNGTSLLTSPCSFASDFLVMVLGYDKIETSLYKTITTSNINAYNYILDYNVFIVPRYTYDGNKFITYENKSLTLNNGKY